MWDGKEDGLARDGMGLPIGTILAMEGQTRDDEKSDETVPRGTVQSISDGHCGDAVDAERSI